MSRTTSWFAAFSFPFLSCVTWLVNLPSAKKNKISLIHWCVWRKQNVSSRTKLTSVSDDEDFRFRFRLRFTGSKSESLCVKSDPFFFLDFLPFFFFLPSTELSDKSSTSSTTIPFLRGAFFNLMPCNRLQYIPYKHSKYPSWAESSQNGFGENCVCWLHAHL